MDFLALDLETPNSKNNSICSVGMTLVKNSEIQWTQSILIDPEAPFSRTNTRIHGIDAQAVVGAPTFAAFMSEFEHLFKHYPLVIHNASFDCGVMQKVMRRYGIKLPEFDVYDTLMLSRLSYPDLPSHTLDVVCKHLGIPLDHHHAGSDSRAAAEIMLKLLADENAVIRTMATLGFVSCQKKSDCDDNLESPSDAPTPSPSPDHSRFLNFINPDPDNLILPDLNYADPPRFPGAVGKRFCITCCVTEQKREAEARIGAIGGTLSKTLTLKTDYLIVGLQNKAVVTDPETGKTGKILEAEDMITKGYPIKFVRMSDFLGGGVSDMDLLQLSFIPSNSSVLSMPETKEDLESFILQHVVESHDDDDVFSVEPLKDGSFSCFLYGRKVLELVRKDSGVRFRLPGDIMISLFPNRAELDDEKLYSSPSLTSDQLTTLVQLLRDRKKKNFRALSSDTFACCNSFVACSDALRCIHEHDREYNGCYYRTNLESGRIFYGKNKNI